MIEEIKEDLINILTKSLTQIINSQLDVISERVNNQAVEIRELTCNQRQLRGSLSRLKSDFNDSRINEKAAIDLNTCRPIPNLSEVATEITQCIIRRQNLIVSWITEINIDNLERRINYDMATLQNIISELGFPTSAVTSARRIGKIQNGTPRLLRVECSSEDVRSKILRSSGKLRSFKNLSSFSSYYISKTYIDFFYTLYSTCTMYMYNVQLYLYYML